MQQKAMLNQHINSRANLAEVAHQQMVQGDQDGTMSKRLAKMAEKDGFPENQLNMGQHSIKYQTMAPPQYNEAEENLKR